MVTKSIDLFVNFVDASNPIYVDASAQTYDGNLMLLLGLFLMALASCCLFIVFRKKAIQRSERRLLLNESHHACTVERSGFKYKVGLSVLGVMLLALSIFSFIVSGYNKSLANEDIAYKDVINAYVNPQEGSITFEEGFLGNESDTNNMKIASLELGKCDGIDDKDCNWQLSIDDNLVIDGNLKEPQTAEFNPSLIIETLESKKLIFKSDISIETAMSLTAKKALKLTIKYAETSHEVSFEVDGNGSISPTEPIKVVDGAVFSYKGDKNEKLEISDGLDTYTFIAQPDASNSFTRWIKDPVGEKITAETTFKAEFKVNPIVTLNLNGGKVEGDVPQGWTLTEDGTKLTREYEYATPYSQIAKDIPTIPNPFKLHKFAYNFDKWNWNQSANVEMYHDFEVDAIYKKMDPVPVYLDLTDGGEAVSEVPEGWVLNKTDDPPFKGYTKSFDVGTKTQDIFDLWNSVTLKHYGYDFDKYTYSYGQDIIQEDCTSITITPTWIEKSKVTIKGNVTDADGFKVDPAVTDYDVVYIDATGETYSSGSSTEDDPVYIQLDKSDGTFEAKVPNSVSGVFRFVPKDDDAHLISQDIAINNVTGEAPINIGTLIVEEYVIVKGKVQKSNGSSVEKVINATVLLTTYSDDKNHAKEVFAGATTEPDGVFEIKVKAHRDFYLSAEYENAGETKYTFVKPLYVGDNDIEVCSDTTITFTDYKSRVVVDLNGGVITDASQIPTGFAKDAAADTNKYFKYYCEDSSTKAILDLWNSANITYSEPETEISLTEWQLSPNIDKIGSNGNDVVITAQWSSEAVFSGTVKNEFMNAIEGASVTVVYDDGTLASDTTTTKADGTYSLKVKLGQSGKVIISHIFPDDPGTEENPKICYAPEITFDSSNRSLNLGTSYIERSISMFGNIEDAKGAKLADCQVEIFTFTNRDGEQVKESFHCVTDSGGNYKREIMKNHDYILQVNVPGEQGGIWYSDVIHVQATDKEYSLKIDLENVSTATIDLGDGKIVKGLDTWTKVDTGKYVKNYSNGTLYNSIIFQWNFADIIPNDPTCVLSGWVANTGEIKEDTKLTGPVTFTAQYIEKHDDVSVNFNGPDDYTTGSISAPYGLTKVPYGTTYSIDTTEQNKGRITLQYPNGLMKEYIFVIPGSWYNFDKWVNTGTVFEIPQSGDITSDFNITATFIEKPALNVNTEVITEAAENAGCTIIKTLETTSFPYGTIVDVDASTNVLIFKNRSTGEALCTYTPQRDSDLNYKFIEWKTKDGDEYTSIAESSLTLTDDVTLVASFDETEKITFSYILEAPDAHGGLFSGSKNKYYLYKKITDTRSYETPEWETINAEGTQDADNENIRYEFFSWTWVQSGAEKTSNVSSFNPASHFSDQELLDLRGETVIITAHFAAPKAIYYSGTKTLSFVYDDELHAGATYTFAVKKDTFYNPWYEPDDWNLPDWCLDSDGTPKVYPKYVVFEESFKNVHGIISMSGWFLNVNAYSDPSDPSDPSDAPADPSDPSGKRYKLMPRQLTSITGWENFDVSQLEDTTCMFASSNSQDVEFNDFDFLQYWENQNVRLKYASAMFMGCNGIKNINIPKYLFSETEYMYDLFDTCVNLQTVTLPIEFGRDAVNTIALFYGCSSLTNVVIDNSSDLNARFMSNSNYYEQMFLGCVNLQHISLSVPSSKTTWGYSCWYYDQMFYNCSKLQDIGINFEAWYEMNEGYIIDCTSSSNNYMFYGCSKLSKIDISNIFPFIDFYVEDCQDHMFYGCDNVTTLIVSKKNAWWGNWEDNPCDYNAEEWGINSILWSDEWYCQQELDFGGSTGPFPASYILNNWSETRIWYSDFSPFVYKRASAYAVVDDTYNTMTFKYGFMEEDSSAFNADTTIYPVLNTGYEYSESSNTYEHYVPSWYELEDEYTIRCLLDPSKKYNVSFDSSFCNYAPTSLAYWFCIDSYGNWPYTFNDAHFNNIYTKNVVSGFEMFGLYSGNNEHLLRYSWFHGDWTKFSETPMMSLNSTLNSFAKNFGAEEHENNNSEFGDLHNTDSLTAIKNNNITNEECVVDISQLGSLRLYVNMFYSNPYITKVILPENWEMGVYKDGTGTYYAKTLYANYMFAYCISLKEIVNLDSINLRTRMSEGSDQLNVEYMFRGCISLESIDLKWFNDAYIYLHDILGGCDLLTKITIGKTTDSLDWANLPNTSGITKSWIDCKHPDCMYMPSEISYHLFYSHSDYGDSMDLERDKTKIKLNKINFKTESELKGTVSVPEYTYISSCNVNNLGDVLNVGYNTLVSAEAKPNYEFAYWDVNGIRYEIADVWQSGSLYFIEEDVTITAHFSESDITPKAVYSTSGSHGLDEPTLTFYYDDQSHSNEGIVFQLDGDTYAKQDDGYYSTIYDWYLNLPSWYTIQGESDLDDVSAFGVLYDFVLTIQDNIRYLQASNSSDDNLEKYNLSHTYIKNIIDAKNVIFDTSFYNYNYLGSISTWFMADSFGNQPYEHFYSVDANTNGLVEDLRNLPTQNVYNFSYAFGGLFNSNNTSYGLAGNTYGNTLTKIDLSNNVFSNSVNLSYAFANCISLNDLKLPKTSFGVYDTSWTFANCESLKSLSTSENFDSLNALDIHYMDGMFFGCSRLNELDLSKFNTAEDGLLSSYEIYLYFPDGESHATRYVPNLFSDCLRLTEITIGSPESESSNSWMLNFAGSGMPDLDDKWKNTRYQSEEFESVEIPWKYNEDSEKLPRYGTFTRELQAESEIKLSVDTAAEFSGKINGQDEVSYSYISSVKIRVDASSPNVVWVDNMRYEAQPSSEPASKFKMWTFGEGFGDLEGTSIPLGWESIYYVYGEPLNLEINAVFEDVNKHAQVIFSADDDMNGFFNFVYDDGSQLNSLLSSNASGLGASGTRVIATYDVEPCCTDYNLPSWYTPISESWVQGDYHKIPAFRPEIERNCQTIRISFDKSFKDYDSLQSMSCWFMPAVSNRDQSVLYAPFQIVSSGLETTSLDMANVNTTNLSTLNYMFGGYEGFNDINGSKVECINIANFDKDNNIRYLSGIFRNCVKLQKFNFDSCGLENVTSMSRMFMNCPAFISTYSDNSTNFKESLSCLKTDKVTDMSYMFAGLNLNNEDLELCPEWHFPENFNTRNVVTMEGFFSDLTGFEELYIFVHKDFDTSNVKNMANLFSNDYWLYDIYIFDEEYYEQNDGDEYPCDRFNTKSVTNMQGMFYNCNQLCWDYWNYNNNYEPYYDFCNYLYFDNAKNTSYMFCGVADDWNFTYYEDVHPPKESDIEGFRFEFSEPGKTTIIENSSYMFYGCQSLSYIDFNGVTITKNCSNMLVNCSVLDKVTFGEQWDPDVKLGDLSMDSYLDWMPISEEGGPLVAKGVYYVPTTVNDLPFLGTYIRTTHSVKFSAGREWNGYYKFANSSELYDEFTLQVPVLGTLSVTLLDLKFQPNAGDVAVKLKVEYYCYNTNTKTAEHVEKLDRTIEYVLTEMLDPQCPHVRFAYNTWTYLSIGEVRQLTSYNRGNRNSYNFSVLYDR